MKSPSVSSRPVFAPPIRKFEFLSAQPPSRLGVTADWGWPTTRCDYRQDTNLRLDVISRNNE